MSCAAEVCNLGTLMALPLTKHLSTDTDVRRWFSMRLSDLDAVTRGCPPRIRCLVPRGRPDTIPPWLMGMSFDWRLRLGFEVPSDPWTTTAFAGWVLAFGQAPFDPTGIEPGDDPVTTLFEHAAEHGAAVSAGADTPRDELELARIAVALSLYESWYRGGVRRDGTLFALGAKPHVSTLTSICPDPAAEELSRLVDVARRGLAPLFPADEVETNPVFDAQGIPADGDLVIDGLLLDLKTVTRPRIQLEWLWQMIGYVLLDGGRRRLGRVGLYLSRHGWLQRWELEELLTLLAGEPLTVERARQEFAAVVRGYDVGELQAAEAPTAPWGPRRRQ